MSAIEGLSKMVSTIEGHCDLVQMGNVEARWAGLKLVSRNNINEPLLCSPPLIIPS